MHKRDYVIAIFILGSIVLIFFFLVINLNTWKVGFEKKVYSLPETGTVIIGEKQVEDKNWDYWTNKPYTAIANNRTYLAIDNPEENFDAIIVVTHEDSKDPIVGLFIRNGTDISIPLIDGHYDLYIYTGQNWNPITKQFDRNPTLNKWFTTFRFPLKTNGGRYMVKEISLKKSEVGTYTTTNVQGAFVVSKEDFPSLISP
jgi:hypothetical protein